MEGVQFWLGRESKKAAQAVVANVHFKVMQEEPETAGWGAPRIPPARTLITSEQRCQHGKLVLSDLVTAEEFEIEFDIVGNPMPGPEGMLNSIMLFTKTNLHYGHQGDRMPALFFIGGTTRIIAYMGHPNNHNAECSASDAGLTPGKKHRVMVRLLGAAFRLFLDGREVCFVSGYTAKYGSMTGVKLFMSDRFSDVADARVSNLVYRVAGMSEELDVWPPPLPPRPPPASVESQAARTLLKGSVQVKADTIVAQGLTTSPEFEFSFDLTPTSVRGFMSSILLLSATGAHYGHQGDRMPAFLFMPGSTRLIAYMGRPGGHNDACSTLQAVPLATSSQIVARLKGADFSVLIDGKPGCSISGYGQKYPAMQGVKLWVGDRFNEAAGASVANVRYRPLP